MRVLLSTYGSRGDVEPLVGLAVQLRALGAEVRVCAPPDEDFAELSARVGVPLLPIGPPMRSMVRPSSAADVSRRVTELIATQFDTVAEAAEGCDALLATGMAHFASRSAAEKLGIHYVYATFCPFLLPSPHHAPPPAELVAFLDAGEPPVYVGFGSMHRVSEDIAQVAIEAIRGQGRRALVGRGWAGLALIDDRDDCLVIGEVNQQQLFGRVAAVVHHGGAGTTTTAARAGAPQVVVPQAGDQSYWAARVADLGIGAAHDGPTPTIESLSVALKTTLTPETRSRATAVAGTIRTDGAMVAANLLLDRSR
jgi:UDP:flavonoid glycosyltransferase YjiC (YdhE family)